MGLCCVQSLDLTRPTDRSGTSPAPLGEMQSQQCLIWSQCLKEPQQLTRSLLATAVTPHF